MKKFQVTVNGNTYEVEVADLGGAVAAPAAPKAAPAPAAPKAAAPAAAPAPAPAPAPAAAPVAEGETVDAPMPGKVWKILKSEGDTVADGDVVMILEAMKMENEITASTPGTIKQIPVAEGQAVNPGDVLFVVG